MTFTEQLLERNATFAGGDFTPVPVVPGPKAVVITCADHRVDPAHILGSELGEVAVVRNAGGRITPAALQSMMIMGAAFAAEGGTRSFELIVLHHTDCGMKRVAENEDLMAAYFGVDQEQLAEKHLSDPVESVRADVEVLRAIPLLSDDLVISGLVYDVADGKVEQVVAPAPLRPN